MRVLVTRVQEGPGSREDWADLAALTLIWQGDPTTLAIEAGGFAAFMAACAPVYERHAFETLDYQRIYGRVCLAATRARVDRMH